MLIFLPSALLSKEQRMKYDYHFNNETISIDIPDSDYDVLIEMDLAFKDGTVHDTQNDPKGVISRNSMMLTL